jgi:hypothetical protein
MAFVCCGETVVSPDQMFFLLFLLPSPLALTYNTAVPTEEANY